MFLNAINAFETLLFLILSIHRKVYFSLRSVILPQLKRQMTNLQYCNKTVFHQEENMMNVSLQYSQLIFGVKRSRILTKLTMSTLDILFINTLNHHFFCFHSPFLNVSFIRQSHCFSHSLLQNC